MGKQTKHDDEMKEILHRLDKQDDVQQQILWLLKGSDGLDIEGVIPTQKRMVKELNTMKVAMSAEIEEINKWREEHISNKWKVDMRDVGKAFAWAIGVLGGIFGLFEILKTILS
jgi:hypothetical protein